MTHAKAATVRPSSSALWSAAAVCALELAAGCERRAERPPVRVAAASDLTAAFQELGRDYERKSGQTVSFTFGSSGLLARQLVERAPFDLFAAASPRFVDRAVEAGACEGSARALFGRGRVALWGKGERIALTDLADPRFRRVAIANPEHAPYGKAAREALESAGLWKALEPRIVYAENVRAALELATSGNAEAALVALSLVIGADAPYTLLDATLHAPIEQELVPCSYGANTKGGRDFASYVASPHGRAVMQRYGFAPALTAERK